MSCLIAAASVQEAFADTARTADAAHCRSRDRLRGQRECPGKLRPAVLGDARSARSILPRAVYNDDITGPSVRDS